MEPIVRPGKISGAKTSILIAFLSILACGLYALPGTLLAVWGFVRYRNARRIYETDPATYQQSFVDAKVAFIVSIAGFVLSLLTFAWTISLFWPIWFGEK